MIKGLAMFNFKEKYKKLIIIGIILLFSNSAVFVHVKACCQMQKNVQNHSCCANKGSTEYRLASRCECKISRPSDFVFEDKNNVTNNLLKYPVLLARYTGVINIPSENNALLHGSRILSKSCSIPIFLKDCSFLI